jgi:hypothetical protein
MVARVASRALKTVVGHLNAEWGVVAPSERRSLAVDARA